jgi:hypothetical protein
MDNLARIRTTQPLYTSGSVLGFERECFRVQTHVGEFPCRRALSCLVEPVEGDKVLMFADPEGACWILAVLEREASTASTDLVLEGNTRLVSQNGSITVSAPRGVRLESDDVVAATTPRFRLVARSAELATQRILAFGETLDVDIKSIKVFARTIDRFVDHVVERCRSATRVVEDSETVRAGRLDLKAERLFSVSGENAVVSAKEVVKVDGRQIHMG